jgi:lambda family phage tail tape measure protein
MTDFAINTKLTVDASGYTVELDKARRSNDALMRSIASAADTVAAKQKAIAEATAAGSNASVKAIINQVNSMAYLAATAGKSKDALAQMRAEAMGIGGATTAYAAEIAKASEHTHEFGIKTAATRRELLVLGHELSQGNYTRFTGSMMVLGETMDAMRYVLSPVGLAFAAVAGSAYAFLKTVHDGYAEINAFNKAITATSGFVGLSAAQMAEMSNGLQTGETNLKSVRTAMAEVAATGAFTADNLALATQAAIGMAADIGVGTDKAAESLAKVQDDVLKWVSEYQKAHHTFSAAQIEEIDNFVKLGDTAGATRAVMQDLARAHAAVEADANAHMGVVVDWWHQLEYSVTRVKNAIMNIGVPDSMDKQVADQYAKVEAAQRNYDQSKGGAQFSVDQAKQALDVEMQRLNVLRQQQTVINTQQRAREAAAKGGDAQIALTNYLRDTTHAGPAKQRDAEIAAENEKFAKLKGVVDKGSKDYQQALKDHYETIDKINSEYAKRTKVHGGGNPYAGQLASMTAANQLIEAEEKRHEAQLRASRDAGIIDSESYLRQLASTQEKALDQEIANAQKRVDIARGKPESAAYQEALKDLKKLQGQRAEVEQTLTESLAKVQSKRAADISRYGQQQAGSLVSQQTGYENADSMRFATAQMKSEMEQRAQLVAQYNKDMTALAEQYDSPTADQKEYKAKLAEASTYFDLKLTALQDNLAKEQAVRDSYTDQMHLAVVKLAGDSQTNAQLAASAFTTAWQDSSNALDEYLTTGQGSFSKFTASILADMAKLALHQAEMQVFSAIGTSFFSTGGPVGHYADGGAIHGAGTGTSDSIPAMLSNGEYVINAASTKKYRSLLDNINHGHMPHFASGGPVGVSSGAGSAGGGSPVSVVVHNNGGGGLNETDAKALHALVSAFVDKRMNQAMRGQGGFAYQMKYGSI